MERTLARLERRELTNDLTRRTKWSVCGAQQNSAVLFNGGSYHAGGVIHVMKVAIKPGNPAASFVNCLPIADPIVHMPTGMEARQPQTCAAVADIEGTRRPGRQQYVPAKIVRQSDDDPLLAKALQKAGSATLMPLAQVDGLVIIPADCTEVTPSDRLKFMPFPDASPR